MKHKILLILLACFTLASCIDDDFVGSCGEIDDIEVPDYLKNGYSLSLKVTLDRMGGTRAATATELEEIENYINPEKFRVLFFDHKDRLLFESKSRWVKMLTPTSKNAEWLVSVPLFTYGNDVYNDAKNKEWPWERIKEALTTNSFKIAILANRHDYDWYPGFPNTGLVEVEGWMDNTGPHWTPDDFMEKTIFDLHHCQYDAVYHGKSGFNNEVQGYYDFIAKDYYRAADGTALGEDQYNKDTKVYPIYAQYRPQMGATSSWAEWDYKISSNYADGGTNYNDNDWITENTSNNKVNKRPIRRFRHPSQDHPIPMYGVQKFNKIEGWSKGTPFNLSEFFGDDDSKYPSNKTKYAYKNISLLRSVVKIELKIPKDQNADGKDKPEIVGLYYSNIYARCEPMDVWTPTDELWDSQHPKEFNFTNNSKCKDMQALLNYGPVATGPSLSSGTGKLPYQRKLSWFYGAWLDNKTGTPEGKSEPWWDFDPNPGGIASVPKIRFKMSDFVRETATTPYPRIFNSYIQRQNAMICDDNVLVDDPNYWYYVVYLGERNMNDPSGLGNMGNTNNGAPTLMYWMFERNDKLYGLPITDYSNLNNPVYNYINPYDLNQPTPSDPNEDYNYRTKHVVKGVKDMTGDYARAMMTENDPDNRPWPLIRNHVYTLTLTTNDIPPYTHTWDFTKMSDNDADIKNIVGASDWERDTSKDYKTYRNTVTINGKLKAGGVPIVAVEDLNFTSKEARGVNFEQVLDNNSTYCLRLDKQEKITFPKIKAGQTITIKVLYPVTAGNPGDRPLIISGDLEIESANDGNGGTPAKDSNGYYLISGNGKTGVNRVHTLIWKAVKTTSVSLTVDASKGLSFTEFIIDKGSATARTTRGTENGIGFKIKAQDFHSESIKFD